MTPFPSKTNEEHSPPADRIAKRPAVGGWILTVLVVGLFLASLPLAAVLGSAHFAAAAATRSNAPSASHAADPLAGARASLALGHGPAAELASKPASGNTSSPPALLSVSMAYDAADHYVLALSPNDTPAPTGTGYGNLSETWTFSGGLWTKLSLPVDPTDRGFASMTYDAKDGYVVMFGGITWDRGLLGSPGLFGDTWTYLNGTWTNLTNLTTSPSPLAYGSMVWDASDQYALLFGGVNTIGNVSSSWEYVGNAWTPLATGSAPPNEGAMSYDSHDGYVVYFGGAYSAGGLSADTWKFHNGTWKNLTLSVTGSPAARSLPMLSDDPNVGGVLLFGGYTGALSGTSNDSWSFVNLTWTQLSLSAGPSPRYEGQMVFDAADNATILFGGTDLNSTFSDTWAFGTSGNASTGNVSTGWTQAAPVLRLSHGVVDAGTSVTFSAGSVFGTGAAQFNYSGLPPGCLTLDAPTLSCVPTTAGTYLVSMSAVVGGAKSAASTVLLVNSELQILSLGWSLGATEPGRAVGLSASVSGGTPWLDFSYAGLPMGCLSQNASTLACTPAHAGNYSVVLSLTDSLGTVVARSAGLYVAVAPSVRAFAVTPTVIDVGQATTISVALAGGLGPFAYSYPTLPSGCTSQNTARLLCTPDGAGAFSVASQVLDSVGGTATATGTLNVDSWPSVVSFGAFDPNVTLGGALTVQTEAVGGTGYLAYSYLGLPPGCDSANVSVLTCSPTAAGTYTVSVEIVDAVGGNSTSEAVVVHVATGPHLPPPSNGGGTSHSGGSTTLFTSAFSVGLLLGLLVLAGFAGALLWRARIVAEGNRIVRDLRRGNTLTPTGPDAEGRTPPGRPPAP
jgi:hypothetical protein